MAIFSDLEDALAQLSPAYDVLGDAVHIVNVNGIVVYANAASNLTYGYEDAEFIGEHISICIPAPLGRISQDVILADPNHVWRGQVQRQRKSGELFDADITLILLTDSSGVSIGRTAVVRDQSEMKRMEGRVHNTLSIAASSTPGVIDRIFIEVAWFANSRILSWLSPF